MLKKSNLGNSDNQKYTDFMSILSKDIIINEILPHLSESRKGKQLSEDLKVSIVEMIIYRLKTGCQWRQLPIKQFYEKPYSWQSVFHHFNKWSKSKSWLKVWENFLSKHKSFLDLSSIQLDGTHTPVKRGGEAVGYQGRKSCVTTNFLAISDANGVLITCSDLIEGQHNDLYDIENQFEIMLSKMKSSGINPDGLFLNADAGFDATLLRNLCFKHGVIPNFCFNKRNSELLERDEYFDELLYVSRLVVEHSFAWLDAFKALLVRYEKKARNWLSLNLIGFLLIFERKITPNLF